MQHPSSEVQIWISHKTSYPASFGHHNLFWSTYFGVLLPNIPARCAVRPFFKPDNKLAVNATQPVISIHVLI